MPGKYCFSSLRSARVALTRCATPPYTQANSFTTTFLARHEVLSASQAAEKLGSVFESKTSIRKQVLDANQLQKLCLTLGRRELDGVDISETPPKVGTPVPPGWHLVYFTPNGLESDLGADGTDRTFNSPAPFTRRMWAGGRMRWQGAPLRVGDEVEERTKFVNATAKTNKAGREMIIVEIEKEFWGPNGLSLVDQRLVHDTRSSCFHLLTLTLC
jgi:hydroxyacyl-ACP dehydratase HTD2-like protein with hotdog domain